MSSQLAHGCDVGGLLGVGKQGEVLGNFPDEDLAIVGPGRDHAVVEGVPAASNHLSAGLFIDSSTFILSIASTLVCCISEKKRKRW